MGMVSAGLATGNAVLLKPAEQAPACGYYVVKALREAGVPATRWRSCPGRVRWARGWSATRGCTRSRSRAGRSGWRSSSGRRELAPGQRHIKRVVAEMGGKNCVIVDSDADLDDVVPALIKSAFNYAGQKCSAAARVLAHEAIHDGLVERLAGAIEVLHVGQASDPEIDVGPVIEREAQERVQRYIETARSQGTIAAQAADVPSRRLVRHADARHRPPTTRRCSRRRSSGRCSRSSG